MNVEDSTICQRYLAEIAAICNSLQSRVQQIVMTAGPIYKEYEAKIDSISSLDEAKEFASRLPQEVTTDVVAQWEAIAQDAQDKVIEILGQVGTDMDSIAYGVDAAVSESGVNVIELSMKDKIQCYRNQYFSGAWVTGIGAGLLASIGVISAPFIAPIVAVAAAIWSFFTGGEDSKEKALRQNKANFKNELSRRLNELSMQLLHVQGNSNLSVVSEYARQLNTMATEAIKNMLSEKKSDLQKRLKDLETQAALETEERKKVESVWTSFKKQWDSIIASIKHEVALRNEIANLLKVK